MLTTETKRHIDAARQVLVGVVPNPSSQIDQITNALIYKFMDDMDQSAIKAGGEASFFIKDLEKFSWTRLIDARIGNQERMNIYAEALVKFSEAKQLPELFRNIFKSAFLPYRSPEVLGLFLKEIAYFDYSHPEELGNAYEYLLSIMGSQGDAGQFRTPRHIIDFIVDVVNPTKDDKVLDPACGTAGFLISAYKHILAQHDGQNSDGSKNSEIPLTPDQKRALVNNFEGYDVDPSMVRIAQVNMYLHKFKNPKIVGYNSLSDDERWGDKFDVILANPPFMSPRGGVSIHNKFSLESTKSEVLFVDYIINHLRPKGRAGVIVPEGIIFSSGTAYKQLRKNMFENGLFAVVSLPQGVFNPYAGVKTSILFFDNALAKKTDKILFVRVLNDGFDLGAQRRPIDRNDLVRGEGEMDATKVLKAQQIALETDTVNPWLQENSIFAYEISKGQIEQSGDYGLSAEKYRVDNLGEQKTQKWPIVELGEICEITSSKRVFESEWKSSGVPFYRAREIVKLVKNGIVENELYISEDMYKEYSQKYGAPKENDLMVTGVGTLGICYQVKKNDKFYFKDGNIIWLRNFSAEVDSGFVKNLFESPIIMDQIRASSVGGTVGTYTITNAKKTKIPLPPMEVQMEIIEQIQGKQSAINHAKEIIKELERERLYFGQSLRKLENTEWVELDEVCEINPKKSQTSQLPTETQVSFVPMADVNENSMKFNVKQVKSLSDVSGSYTYFGDNDVLLAKVTPCLENGKAGIARDLKNGIGFGSSEFIVLRASARILPEIIYGIISSADFREPAKAQMTGTGGLQRLSPEFVRKFKIPLPSLEVQKQLVDEMKKEETIIIANRQLIELMENKITSVLSGV